MLPLLRGPSCISFTTIFPEEGEYLSVLRNVNLRLARLAFRPGMDRFLRWGLRTCIAVASCFGWLGGGLEALC